tara:strand:- start:176 stop:556 length:381 start_codon:yes stop_codon:yes gene_type:complete
MKFQIVIILLFSFVFQTNVASTLRNIPQSSRTAISQNIHSHCCCKSIDTTPCCAEGTQDDGKNSGNHNCGGPACHCPLITMVSIVSPIGENKNDKLFFSSKKNNWQFIEQLLKSVYFPVWSPPKLS